MNCEENNSTVSVEIQTNLPESMACKGSVLEPMSFWQFIFWLLCLVSLESMEYKIRFIFSKQRKVKWTFIVSTANVIVPLLSTSDPLGPVAIGQALELILLICYTGRSVTQLRVQGSVRLNLWAFLLCREVLNPWRPWKIKTCLVDRVSSCKQSKNLNVFPL